MIHTQFNLPIKALQTDHGGKYTFHDFQSYLLHHGIHHQFSCSYTPEQNGIAERKNCHILETSPSCLPPPIFLVEATTTAAAYLINRFPTKTLNMASPYHKLYHQSPSYLHLKTFRCLCYSWTAYSRAHKLDPKSSTCIFLGYSSDHKGFRCFDPATSKLIISRHVRFHEHEFPMPNIPIQHHHHKSPLSITLFPQSSPPHSIQHPQPPTLSPTGLPPIHPHLPRPAIPTPTFNINAAVLTLSFYQTPHYLPFSPHPSHHLHLPKPPDPHPHIP